MKGIRESTREEEMDLRIRFNKGGIVTCDKYSEDREVRGFGPDGHTVPYHDPYVPKCFSVPAISVPGMMAVILGHGTRTQCDNHQIIILRIGRFTFRSLEDQ
jgi:hypothetical protein